MNPWATLLLAALSGGALSALAALLLFPSQRAKLGAEREQITVAATMQITGGYGHLVEDLRAEVTRLEVALDACRGEVARLGELVDTLRRELRETRLTRNGDDR